MDAGGAFILGTGRGNGIGVVEGNATVDSGSLVIQNDSTLTLRGDSVTNTGFIAVGGATGNSGAPHPTLTISERAVLNGTNVSIGDRPSRPGVVNQDGGTFTTPGLMRIGHWGSETSTYNMSGGSLNLTGTPSANTNTNSGNNDANNPGILYLGIDGTGIMNHSGGDISAHGLVLDNRGNTGGTDQYNMTGGSLTLKGTGIKGNTGGSYEVNLGGGTVRAAESFTIETPATLTGTGGNVTFDTNGNDITIPAASTLDGAGGFNKTGQGMLVLAGGGVHTYTGPTMVDAGTLLVDSDNSAATGDVTILGGTLAGTGTIGGRHRARRGLPLPGQHHQRAPLWDRHPHVPRGCRPERRHLPRRARLRSREP